jgi:polysaccharide export outer membrane protein
MKRFRALLVLAALALRPSAGAAQDSGLVDPNQLTLQPGDAVRVQIWQEEDMSGEFLVDSEGIVVLPLLGEKQVTGIPVRDLRRQLVQDYQVHLRNPSISITPLRRLHVLGEVQRPGLYAVDPTTNLAGAIAMAGGATPTGTLANITILRDGQRYRSRVGAGTTVTIAGVRSGDQIIVERRGWFERNSTFVVSTLISLATIVSAIIINSNPGGG